ncbi:2-hydroxyacid dehydrogenase [Bombiscardovia apis]|uniref:2-hydroxyacid dehydrogenase n=1 Tax=Bombiscardovia apis TaxID=2932182 RepID=A0ABM8BCM3_9BIFI|nr:D-2-hydroxyacid dehydrogenase [Bombiscardovia apis]BDR54608.1 2-hydroxyacid dehydrogenase [Bombiscardovia apis]
MDVVEKNEQVCIVNALPMEEGERERFIDLAQGAQQWFITPDQEGLETLPKDWHERVNIVLGNLPPADIAKCSNLQWLQTESAGVNAYQKPGVLGPQVKLTGASGAYGKAVSEHMFAMMWALMKHLPEYRDLQDRKQWKPLGQTLTPSESTVLVLGTGDIGSHFAQLAHNVGAHTVGVRRNPERSAPSIDDMHSFEDLDQLLPQADVVALALPAAADTHYLMNEQRLQAMKERAILINAGRGDAVDCAALARVLASGHLWGVGLDVSDPEPLPADHPLWAQDRCLITPHVAGGASLPSSHAKVIDIVESNLERFLAGKDLINRVQ